MAMVERCGRKVLEMTVYEATRKTDDGEYDLLNEHESVRKEQIFMAHKDADVARYNSEVEVVLVWERASNSDIIPAGLPIHR